MTGGRNPPFAQSVTRFHILLCNLVLPYIAQPGAFLEDRATCVLLEVVNLAAITRVAQDGSSRRLSIYMSDNIA